MKAIILHFSDGQRYLAFVVPAEFDTQAWAKTRREALQFFRCVRITEQIDTQAARRSTELKALLREARSYVASIAVDDDRSIERELLARIDAAL